MFDEIGGDPEFVGDRRQSVEGGLGATGAGQLQFVGVRDVFGHPRPPNDGGQGSPLDQHGDQNDDRDDEDDQVAVWEWSAAIGGHRHRQRCGKRYRAAETGPACDATLTEADVAGGLLQDPVHGVTQDRGCLYPGDPGGDNDTRHRQGQDCGPW
ncbi:Uncharacterised protein [Mycobacterium tuberculosis]|uniref:Uncharacterized protein n=1 Tax=Mycobacterium tuberculosis TaxID=1773 RepID=A0A655APT2_MYCTX|nr:Uncharacterised protein [Mycobacterium tuberculosis]CKS46734.1 Uncharacterised protein [Mycobacterium tuberculosis]CKT37093.1 Uncharacterised protein [Mycobacterium tuberculosis]